MGADFDSSNEGLIYHLVLLRLADVDANMEKVLPLSFLNGSLLHNEHGERIG